MLSVQLGLLFANIIKGMQSGQQQSIIRQLHEDWSVLLEGIRMREQLHLNVVEKTSGILNRRRAEDDEQSIAQELQQHKQYLQRTLLSLQEVEQNQKDIADNYQSSVAFQDSVKRVVNRIASKIIQITQKSLQALKQHDQKMQQQHSRMKRAIIAVISQTDNINLQRFLEVAMNYSKAKLTAEVQKYQLLVAALERKEFDRIKDICNPPQKPRVNSLEKVREVVIIRKRDLSLNRQQRSLSKRLAMQKKKTSMFILYGIMLLSKHQLIDDLGGSPHDKKQRIYQELLNKNKKNKYHIEQFILLEDNYVQKIKRFQQNPPKTNEYYQEVIEGPQQNKNCAQKIHNKNWVETIQNKSCAETICQQKKQKQLGESVNFNECLATEVCNYRGGFEQDYEQDGAVKEKASNVIKNKISPVVLGARDSQDFPLIYSNHHNKTMSNQEQDSKFAIIKKDSMFEPRKGRLPNINRKTSLEDKKILKIPRSGVSKTNFKPEDINNIEEDILKTNKRKEKWIKDERLSTQRTKIILKNIEVGTSINTRREDLAPKGDESVIRERKKTDSTTMDNTAYCKRTMTKFFDYKLIGIS